MIVDEAGMLELSNFDYLTSRARAAGAKVIASGDLNQIPAIGYASGFRTTKEIASFERLEESIRQKNPVHQKITKLLSNYQVRKAVRLMIREKMITFTDSEIEANSKVIREFTKEYIKTSENIKRDDLVSTRTLVIGVYTNETRRLLNNGVRENLKEAGIIKGEEHEYLVGYHKDGKAARLKLSRGDQVVFANNVNKLGRNGIFNGEVATILKAGAPNEKGLGKLKLLVHKASGRREKITLNFEELSKLEWFKQSLYLEHGYAVTAHKV
ncbi:MAG: AAA family ATPase, partial [Gammaproteobacteria bacterium]|nr:AAA family ATPase [Gammaproteobacteria bacterium]